MRHTLEALTFTAVLCGASASTLSAMAGESPRLACGKIVSIGSPADVQSKSQPFGLTIVDANQTPHALGIARNNPDAIPMLFMLLSAYVRDKEVTVFYSEQEKTVSCVVTQQDTCPSTPEGKCIAAARHRGR